MNQFQRDLKKHRLGLKLKYHGNGVVGYTPVFQKPQGQWQEYTVKGVEKILSTNAYLLHPDEIPYREGIYTRGSGLFGLGSTDLIADFGKYGNLEYARVLDAAQSALLNNGVTFVGGALVASSVLVVGAVAVDAGLVAAGASIMVDVASGARVAAKIVADNALNALAIGSKGIETFAAQIAEGAAPVISVLTEAGTKYFVAAAG